MSIENTHIGSLQSSMLAKMNIHKSVVGVSEVGSNVASDVHSLSFGSVMKGVVENVNAQQVDARRKVDNYELGLSDDLLGATVASQKASLSFSAMMEVRNKLVKNFDELIKMPL